VTRASVSGALALGVMLLAACGLLPVVQDPEQPMGPIRGMELDMQPVGPVVEIGRGESVGISWRYTVHESALGTCTSVESDGQVGGTSCGGTLGPEPPGAVLSLMSWGTSTGFPSTVEGFAAEEVATAWIRLETGGRAPATLMSLEPVGMDGQLFYAVIPAGQGLNEVVALDEQGEVLATEPLDHP
jgi:hypothetical protein